MNSPAKGNAQLVLSAAAFALMTLLVKILGQRLPSQEIVFVRAAITLVLSWALLRRAGVAALGNQRGLLLLRGLFGFLGLSCFFYALTRLPIAEASVIQYTNPIFTTILAALTLGERAGPRRWLAALVGFAGVLLVVRPAALFGGHSAQLDRWAVSIALLGALMSAGAYVTVRHLSSRENPLVIVLYFPLVTLPLSLPSMLPGALWPNVNEWLLLAAVALLAQCAQVALTRGMRHVQAGAAMTVLYLQVLFATLLGALILGEIPGLWTLAGSLLILAGTVGAVVGTAEARSLRRGKTP